MSEDRNYRQLIKSALLQLEELQAKLAESERARNEPIAIIGLGCRFPGGANSPEAYWRLLRDGVDAVAEIPKERWDVDAYFDANADEPGKVYARHAGLLDQREVEEFDPQFFGIAPREAAAMDPQQRKVLEVCWEAVEDAGLPPESLQGSLTGLFVGGCTDDYLHMFNNAADPRNVDAYTSLGTARGIAVGRVAHVFGFEGPVVQLDTACSSSLLAVHMACQNLRGGECNLALAGGVNLQLSPVWTLGLCRLKALSPDGRCRAFDAGANGFVRGEGCGVVVLKRLSDALRDRDRVLAVIPGGAVNHDGRSGGLTVPSELAQEKLLRQALNNAHVEPGQVSYIEAHGTGTPLGDPIEMGALRSVFASGRSAEAPLLVGSVKTNFGHVEAAAGIAGFIKVVLALQHKEIPASLHFEKPNPLVPWDGFAVRVPTERVAWPGNGERPIAGVSSFGFSGTNVHVLVEGPPQTAPTSPEQPACERPLHVLPLSAKTEPALSALAERYGDFLADESVAPLEDVAFTAGAGRAHFAHRLAVVAASVEEARAGLQSLGQENPSANVARATADKQPPSVAFLFTGEGSQYGDMGRKLFETQPTFRRTLQQCDELLRPTLERSLLSVLYPDVGQASPLDQARYAQPALFALEYALAQLWKSWGVTPTAVMGHGVGEYVAASLAGVFSLEDGLKLAAARGRFLKAVSETGATSAATAEFADVAAGVKFAPPHMAIVSTFTGAPALNEIGTADYWCRHLMAPVRFAEGLRALTELESRILLEIGPHPTLATMDQQGSPGHDRPWLPSLRRDQDDWSEMLRSLAELYVRGVDVDWQGFDRDYIRNRSALPTYPFQRKKYWVQRPPCSTHQAGVASTHGERQHPLLGSRLESAGKEVTFEVRLGPQHPAYLNDHRVFGTPVLPATAYLEIALASGEIVCPDSADRLRIEELTIERALTLPEGETQTVQAVLAPVDGRWEFQLFSRDESSESNGATSPCWTRHATATLAVADDARPDAVDLSALAEASSEPVSIDEHYQELSRHGLDYGPKFQALNKLSRGEGEALAEVRLPAELLDELGDYRLHPVLLDAALQALTAVLPDAQTYLPVGLDGLRVFATPDATLWSHVQLKQKPTAESRSIAADIRLLAASGEVVAELQGLRLQQVDRDRLARQTMQNTSDWFYKIAWQPQLRAEQPARLDPGTWLVFSDDGDVATGLIEKLRDGGQRCVVAWPGEEFSHDAPDAYRVRPTSQEDFGGLLEASLADEPPSLRGVIHLWSLQEHAPDHQELTCAAVLNLVQALAAREVDPRVWLVTRGAQSVRDPAADVDVSQGPLWGLGRVIALEHPEFQCVRIDLDPAERADTATMLFEDITTSDAEDQIAYRAGTRHVARLVRHTPETASRVEIPKTPYRLQLPEYGVFEKFRAESVSPRRAGPGEVEIAVEAAALNFRDVLRALGMLQEYETSLGITCAAEAPFGFECAGKVVSVGAGAGDFAEGDAVVAIAPGCMSSHMTVDARHVVRKPERLTFAEAATIPVAFMTAHHALNQLAQLQPGQRVLVHAAAGGVGLAAVQIARKIGAEIIATASPAKWDFLKSLGLPHVLNSRTTDFADEVLRLTDGQGVDVVLNCLSGEFIPAGLKALAPGGTFVEIGKIGAWTAEQVAEARPDVRYFAFDLGEQETRQPGFMGDLLREIMRRLASGELTPLPSHVVPVEDAPQAFRLMSQAKHVGKIVLELGKSRAAAAAPRVRGQATYLITGGLGGLGLRVARWLVEQGARHLALVGRHGPERIEQQQAIRELEQSGAEVRLLAADVSQRSEVERVLHELAESMPPLRGVVHAAGVLDDGVLCRQDWPRFDKVLAPKISGAWHLHTLTKEMDLDLFVSFSSAVSQLGSAGQGNYAAANAFLDALAQHRRAAGLPVLSVNWGPWQSTGMAASLGRRERSRLAESGLEEIDPSVGLQVLGKLLEGDDPQLTVLPVNWSKFCATVGRLPLWSDLAEASSEPVTAEFRARLDAAPAADRGRLLSAHVSSQVAHVLGFDHSHPVPRDQGFFDLGMDSLTSVELRNRLQSSLGCTLPQTVAFDHPTVEALATYLLDDALAVGAPDERRKKSKPAAATKASRADEPIAIVGMSCRMPGGCDDPEAFWQLMARSEEAISEVPPDRWDIDALYDPNPNAPGKMTCRYGGFLPQVDQFDASYFGIMPREARSLDPQQRLLLEVSQEALDDAAIAGEKLAGSPMGVFIGIASWDYLHLTSLYYDRIDAYLGTGGTHSTAAGRLSYTFGLRGPALSVDTACSSALVALHLACQSIRNGECDSALTGGVNLIISPETSINFSKARMLAPDGRCKSFDAGADGYVRGEGAAMVVLKRLSEAQADGDRILAVIRGTAINQDGRSSGLTVPSGPAQQEVIRSALAMAGVEPDDVGYLEAHGTGTPLGDPIELGAIGAVFRGRQTPLVVGSVKTNIGHLEVVSGIAGLIKVVLAMRHEAIPRHLHFENPNPKFDWDQLPIEVPVEMRPWPSGKQRRLAGVSSFGFSGTNAHVVVEEPPTPTPTDDGDDQPACERPLHLLPLSTKMADSLPELTGRYVAHLASHPEVQLPDVCHTAAIGRAPWEHRLAVVAATAEEAQQQLTAYQTGQEAAGVVTGQADDQAQIAFLFTGQGSQYVGMGRMLYETQPTFRRALDECDAILRPALERPLLSVLYPESGESPLDQTGYTQPAMFALEHALHQLWTSWGVEPAVTTGHSVGEYVAACAAGVFSLQDGLKLIAARGRLMQSLPAGGEMVAVMADEARVVQALAGHEKDVSLAAINGPRQIVISGRAAALAEIVAGLEADGIRTTKLVVSHAFHSPLMEPILDEFYAIASEVTYSPPQLPLISNVTGEEATADVATPEYWRDHIRRPVQFARCMATLAARGCDVLLEVGPQPTLLGLGRQSIDGSDRLWLPSLARQASDWQTMLTSVANLYVRGAAIDWEGFDRDYRREKLALPSYPFKRQRFWVDLSPHATEVGSAGASGGKKLHPLLGTRLNLAGDQIAFQGELAADSPSFLADHCVFDCPILPATAYLEAAMAAGHQLPGAANVVVEDVTLAQALPLPPDVRPGIQILLEPQDEGHGFRFFSRHESPGSEAGEAPWRQHAWGRITLAAGAEAPSVDLAAIRERCWVELPVEEFYEQFRAVGLGYGPGFQGIKQLWRGEGEALGELHLPEALAADADQYHLHPALLDAAIQVLAGASPDFTSQTYLPVGVERLRQFAPSKSKVFSHVRLRDADEAEPSFLIVDIELIDDDGQTIASLQGLRLKEVQRTALEGAVGSDPGDWLHELVWRARPSQIDPPVVSEPGTWLILAEPEGPGADLAEQLRLQGQRCLLATPGETYGRQSADSFTLNPAIPKDFHKLLAEALDAEQPPLRGVVELWSLAAQTKNESPVASHDGNGSPAGGNGEFAGERDVFGAPADPVAQQARDCGGTLHLVQALAQAELSVPLWLVTRGAQPVAGEAETIDAVQAPLWGLGRVIALEQPQLRCTRVDLDPAAEQGPTVDQLLHEVLAADEEDQVAYRGGTRHVARVVRSRDKTAGKLEVPARPYRLQLSAYGSLDDFQLAPITRRRAGRGEVEVNVEAAGLNFRDVLRALGMLQEFEIPLGITSAAEAPFGFECAGRVTAVGEGVADLAVGDEVLAVGSGTMRSHIVLDARHLVRKPANLSAAEAASIPLAFLTAYFGLEKLAQLKPGDRVLIHAAAGGVGQAAVQIAQRIGAEIFATASPGKWDFLREQGIEHIMNSRTADFADEVLERTDGRGVDVVLNSLTGDFIPANLKALGQGGRFVEIGKIGIWTTEQMAEARPDVSYFAFDLSEEEMRERGLMGRLLEELMPRFAKNELAPLPIEVFPMEQTVAAFRKMAQAQHRGKVVLALAGNRLADEEPLVRADGSYIITGGLGALGLTVARWLVEQGAKHLVLTGRRGAESPEKQAAVRELEQAGATVRAVAADVSNRADVECVIAEANDQAPLRGVVHAAGVLRDGMLRQMSWQQFEEVLQPKMAGAWHLHTLTEAVELDFFISFSSVASMIGSPGQANYAAANAYLDGLAHQRRAAGLPALSINWGPWGGIGMAARLDRRDRARMAETGWGMIEVPDGLQIMGRLMAEESAQVGVLPVDWQRFTTISGSPPMFEEVAAEVESTGTSDFLEAFRAAPADERRELVVWHIREQIAAVLACDSPDAIRPRDRLFDLGMDSLTSVELQNRLQRDLGIGLPTTLAFDYPTVEALAGYFMERLAAQAETEEPSAEAEGEPGVETAVETPAATPLADEETDEQRAQKLEDLTDEEVEELLRAKLANLS